MSNPERVRHRGVDPLDFLEGLDDLIFGVCNDFIVLTDKHQVEFAQGVEYIKKIAKSLEGTYLLDSGLLG